MLRQYLDTRGEKDAEFARRIGISRSYLCNMLSGRQRPSLDLAVRIERATDGQVPATGWVRNLSEDAA